MTGTRVPIPSLRCARALRKEMTDAERRLWAAFAIDNLAA